MGYKLFVSQQAKRDLKAYRKKSPRKYTKIEDILFELSVNPFNRKLRTHKVRTKKNGLTYSTRITGDLRILWNFDRENSIRLIAVGGHSGRNSVYS